MNLAERYESSCCFRMETEIESTLIPYQDWTAELLHLHSCTKSVLLPDDIDYDMECFLYFRYVLGLGSNIDSQGVRVKLKTNEHFYRMGQTGDFTHRRNSWERAG